MTIRVGDAVPNATLINQTGDTVANIDLAERIMGKRAVIFGLPGAYTGVCSSAHLPSFVRTAQAFRDKGIDEIICIAVNDVRVMHHWGQESGAEAAGILMLSDWASEFTKGAGREFTVPFLGLKDRCTRFAGLAENGVFTVLQFETDHSVCDLTAGETLLEKV